jgi:hypothetical protein
MIARSVCMDEQVVVAATEGVVSLVKPHCLDIESKQRWKLADGMSIEPGIVSGLCCIELRIYLNFYGVPVSKKRVKKYGVQPDPCALAIVCATIVHLAPTFSCRFYLYEA